MYHLQILILYLSGYYVIKSSAISSPNVTVEPSIKKQKVICYISDWAMHDYPKSEYYYESVNKNLCSHIIYGPAVLEYYGLLVKSPTISIDYDRRLFDLISPFKEKGIKVLLSLGDWSDSSYKSFSSLLKSAIHRRRFIDHILNFITINGFDGFDFDWRDPFGWQFNATENDTIKDDFTALIKQLHCEFQPRGLLLSASVSGKQIIIDQAYDVQALTEYFDWIMVRIIEDYGLFDEKTKHPAPLYNSDDMEPYFNANFSINYWISKGVPSNRLFMEIPLFGVSHFITDLKLATRSNVQAIRAPFVPKLKRNFLAYHEFCSKIYERGWKIIHHPKTRMGPYAFNNIEWIAFDDITMIKRKAQFIKDMNLGGALAFALNYDDDQGYCNQGRYPLINSILGVFNSSSNALDKPPRQQESTNEMTDAFKIMCSFSNWASYRRKYGQFIPEHIDRNLCTHVIYSYSTLDKYSLIMKESDYDNDISNKFYKRVVDYKAKGLKVIVTLGGLLDFSNDKYTRLIQSASARLNFITNAVEFIERYGFDGLQLDTVCWGDDCQNGLASDKEGFKVLVEELSAAFKPKGFTLSSTILSNKQTIDKSYDIPILVQHLDWIVVIHHDYRGMWNNDTGHVAPLYGHPDILDQTFNAHFAIEYLIEKGVPAKKLILSVPFYGQSFTLEKKCKHTTDSGHEHCGLNTPTKGLGKRGQYIRSYGVQSYFEICEKILKEDWAIVQDPVGRIGPYAYKGDQWISFDDAEQVKRKAQFIKNFHLGGAMGSALDLDDFENHCQCEQYPLLRTINRVLRNYPDGPTCSLAEPITAERIKIHKNNQRLKTLKAKKKLICYYESWYGNTLKVTPQFHLDDINFKFCTHIVYMWGTVNNNTLESAYPPLDIDKKLYANITAFKVEGIKVLIGLGGKKEIDERYIRLISNHSARQHFIKNAVQFMKQYDFDGLEIAFLHRLCRNQKCNKEAVTSFVKEISSGFRPKGLLVSAMFSGEKEIIDEVYDVPILSEYLDWINVITYNVPLMNPNLPNNTRHISPLYNRHENENYCESVNCIMTLWLKKGAAASKLVMGDTLYGQNYILSDEKENIFGSLTQGTGNLGKFSYLEGLLTFPEICQLTKSGEWSVIKDHTKLNGPYVTKGNQWISFNDISSLAAKAAFIRRLGFAGGAFYSINADDFLNVCSCGKEPLLNAFNNALNGLPISKDCI